MTAGKRERAQFLLQLKKQIVRGYLDSEPVKASPVFAISRAPEASAKPPLGIEQFSGLPQRAKAQVFF